MSKIKDFFDRHRQNNNHDMEQLVALVGKIHEEKARLDTEYIKRIEKVTEDYETVVGLMQIVLDRMSKNRLAEQDTDGKMH